MLGFINAKNLSNGFHMLMLGLVVLGTLATIFVSSVVMYGIFWWYMIPQSTVTMPIDFMFDKQPTSSINAFSSIDLCDFADLTTEDYSLSIELDLPRSELNRQAGNFVTVFYFSNTDLSPYPPDQWRDISTQSRARMSLLPYRSTMLEFVDDLALAPLYIFGLHTQTSAVKLNVADHLSRPVKNTRFLGIGVTEHLDISRAQLVWKIKLRGVRWMMSRFPLLSFFVGTGFIMYIELVTTFVVVLTFMIKSKQRPLSQLPLNFAPNREDRVLEERFQQHFKQHTPTDSTIKSIEEKRRPSPHTVRRRNVPMRQVARRVGDVRRRLEHASESSWDALDDEYDQWDHHAKSEDTLVNTSGNEHSGHSTTVGSLGTHIEAEDEAEAGHGHKHESSDSF